MRRCWDTQGQDSPREVIPLQVSLTLLISGSTSSDTFHTTPPRHKGLGVQFQNLRMATVGSLGFCNIVLPRYLSFTCTHSN